MRRSVTTRRTRYSVALPGYHVARFSCYGDAIRFARWSSQARPGLFEVAAPDGLVGQFCNGRPTAEFDHLNREPLP